MSVVTGRTSPEEPPNMSNAAKIDRKRFDTIRAAALAARTKLDDFRIGLEVKYGGRVQWASRGEQTKLSKLQTAYDRCATRMYTLLEASPRVWMSGVPSH